MPSKWRVSWLLKHNLSEDQGTGPLDPQFFIDDEAL